MASSRRADAIIEGRRESAGAWGVHSAGRPRGRARGRRGAASKKAFSLRRCQSTLLRNRRATGQPAARSPRPARCLANFDARRTNDRPARGGPRCARASTASAQSRPEHGHLCLSPWPCSVHTTTLWSCIPELPLAPSLPSLRARADPFTPAPTRRDQGPPTIMVLYSFYIFDRHSKPAASPGTPTD